MQLSGAPTQLTIPFAQSGSKNTIPVAASATPGLASYTTGFPALTMTPLSAGGMPPAGQDFNGILNAVTAQIQYENAGGTYPWNSAYSSAIGGYPKGAIVAKANGIGFWASTTDNNVTNPEAGGAGWFDMTAGRLLNVASYSANATYTPNVSVRYIEVELMAAGGAGGGVPVTSASQIAVGSGGNAGAYCRAVFLTSALPSSIAITVGSGGVGVAGGTGGTGGNTSFGASVTANGGPGGTAQGLVSAPLINGNGSVASSGGGYLNGYGMLSVPGIVISNSIGYSGQGANSQFGTGGGVQNNTGAGVSAQGYGAGGSGALAFISNATARVGGNGASGFLIIHEYS